MSSAVGSSVTAKDRSSPPKFYAHSSPEHDQSRWQLLTDHLRAVGELASARAAVFGGESLARLQGELHDVGKYTAAFQRRLAGGSQRVEHSTCGARIAAERYGAAGRLLAYGIAGHHAGLANGEGEGERSALAARLADPDLPELAPVWEQEIRLPLKITPPALKLHPHRRQFQYSFLTRMLFSCLVDADFIETEAFYLGLEGRESGRGKPYPTLVALRERLNAYLAALPTIGEVNALREKVLRHAREQAASDTGLFSLTVPTGGGKTLTSLAFALDHAIHHGLRRVIFVIPYTSIVEQNAAVFRRALGPLGELAVLEHHSAFIEQAPPRSDPERYEAAEKLRLAMENWDAPIVVTTAVQFFESLFAARPSQCRKLHNIAGSVVVLDETQTLPLHLIRPCVAAIDELARNYRTSLVLCTATQPALEAPKFDGGLDKPRELAPDPPGLYRALRRVRIRHLGTVDDQTIVAELRSREQVLCIVNNRRHARALFREIECLPGVAHLSTLMCARHRTAVLDQVRHRLACGEPCRVVSTSLVEAGVDVDFPTVIRAEAGLDSVAQAAGRCNREGRRAVDQSEVLVFASANEEWAPPQELKQYAQTAREILRHHGDDPLAPETIRRYFELLYWQQGDERLDRPGLLSLLRDSRIESLPMETIAAVFRMIDDAQVPVIVPYDDDARSALRSLQFADRCAGIARKLQPYIVQVPRKACLALRGVGAVQPIAADKWGEQFLELVNMALYKKHTGLSWDDPARIAARDLVL